MGEAVGHELLQEFNQGLEQLTLTENLGKSWSNEDWEQASVQGQEHVFARTMGQVFGESLEQTLGQALRQILGIAPEQSLDKLLLIFQSFAYGFLISSFKAMHWM